MRKVKSIDKVGEAISFTFNDRECAVFHPFSSNKDIYTTTTEKVLKKTLINIKADIKATNWNVEELRKNWL